MLFIVDHVYYRRNTRTGCALQRTLLAGEQPLDVARLRGEHGRAARPHQAQVGVARVLQCAHGRIGQRPRAVWLQVVRVALAGWRPRLRRASRWTVDRAYAAYAHAVFWLLAIPSWLLIVLLPGEGMRWAIMRRAARLLFLLTGVPMRVEGLEHWPRGRHCVIVANHASYVDGPLLKGYLPWRFNFVIKGELRDFAPAHFLLARSGSKFVERTNIQGSTRDARQLVKAALRGESLGFFPEGTFREEPGVGRFRPGAFVAAMKSDMPVIPIAIHGSRAFLPHGAFLPRRRPMIIDILPAIGPGDSAYANSRTLAEASRQRILAVLDEPDLADNESGSD